MTDELYAALAAGATAVTANARLARALSQAYGARQLAAGRPAWATPAILPWTAFVDSLWNAHAAAEPPLLTTGQEQALWESIVNASPASAGLLQPHAAARLAQQAWALIHAWRVPLGAKKTVHEWDATEETKAFFGWAREFQFQTRWLGRSDAARQVETLLSLPLTGPREIWLAGFDELTPRQKDLINALERAESRIRHEAPAAAFANASLAALPDRASEAEAAAAWCRRRLDANPRAAIGVVAADLESRRNVFERALRHAAPGAFHISLGPALAQRPMIAAALRLLEFGEERVSFPAIGAMLLSPWVAGFAEEGGARAALEVELRRWRSTEIAGWSVGKRAPAGVARALRFADAARRDWPAEQAPSAWSAAFARMLSAFGWPGDAALSSGEFQTLEAWRSALSALASIDLATPALTFRGALALLRRMTAEIRFETESRGEPIQIVGALEAAGSRFDHLWLAGMHDEAWPARPAPNPFIPLALQRRHDLPHASPARELAYARRVTKRLLQSADETVVSYARSDGEREQAPSPLFARLPAAAIEAPEIVEVRAPEYECFDDAAAPASSGDAVQQGGTRALEMQAKCPFRAFAEMRLGARELDDPEAGLDPRDRGTGMHKALELFWKRFPSSAAIAPLEGEALRAEVAQDVERVLAERRTGGHALKAKLLELERLRMVDVLCDWIEGEKARATAFTVEEPEQERTVEIGGLTVKVRLDRLDRLASGAYALIDYKTTAPSLADWEGARPESPQLPIYAVSAREPLAAIAFAQLKAGDQKFRGYASIEDALPGVKTIEPAELSERIEGWRAVLEALGRDFRAGRAEVDPKERFQTCDYCHLAALCRVDEKKAAQT